LYASNKKKVWAEEMTGIPQQQDTQGAQYGDPSRDDSPTEPVPDQWDQADASTLPKHSGLYLHRDGKHRLISDSDEEEIAGPKGGKQRETWAPTKKSIGSLRTRQQNKKYNVKIAC
jgi:hypothetical protein